jgi:hypothetical protein
MPSTPNSSTLGIYAKELYSLEPREGSDEPDS